MTGTVNQVDIALKGSTGTGNFVGANTPTLITPVLGAATATSINFGGSSLKTYGTVTPFTPTITFGTPGDLSVVYTAQVGASCRIGSVVFITFRVACTPTYTTSSGNFLIASLPFSPTTYFFSISPNSVNTGTWPVGSTAAAFRASAGNASLELVGNGSASGTNSFTQANIVSGVAIAISGSGFYFNDTY